MQTDLWAGLNCHVTFFVVDSCSRDVAGFSVVVTGSVSMEMGDGAAVVADTPMLPALDVSCFVNISLITSDSVCTGDKSQSGSTGSRLGRATMADLLPEAEILDERLGSESDRSESQSLSPATEPQPRTDTSTGPESELSESDSLEEGNRADRKRK